MYLMRTHTQSPESDKILRTVFVGGLKLVENVGYYIIRNFVTYTDCLASLR